MVLGLYPGSKLLKFVIYFGVMPLLHSLPCINLIIAKETVGTMVECLGGAEYFNDVAWSVIVVKILTKRSPFQNCQF